MARCRYCRGPKPNPLAPSCGAFECKCAAIREHNQKKREKLAMAKKPIRLRQTRSTGAPTVAEKAWMDSITALGCIVCRLQGRGYVPAEVHHLKQGNRRMGHLFSIGLCVPHHRGGAGEGPFISRHPWKQRFEAEYGVEKYLLLKLKGILCAK